MKLIFFKKDNEIKVQLAVGTITTDFSYTEMIKQLLRKNKFENTDYNGLLPAEKARIEEMLKRISEAVKEEK